jgi:hypothetical protein
VILRAWAIQWRGRPWVEARFGKTGRITMRAYLEESRKTSDAIFTYLRDRERFAERRHRHRDHPAFQVLLYYGAIRHNATMTRYVWLQPICQLRDLADRLDGELGTLAALCRRFELSNDRPINYASIKTNVPGLLPRRIQKALALIGYGTPA